MKVISLLSLEASEITRSCFGMAACVLLNFKTVCAIIFFKPGAYFLLVLK